MIDFLNFISSSRKKAVQVILEGLDYKNSKPASVDSLHLSNTLQPCWRYACIGELYSNRGSLEEFQSHLAPLLGIFQEVR